MAAQQALNPLDPPIPPALRRYLQHKALTPIYIKKAKGRSKWVHKDTIEVIKHNKVSIAWEVVTEFTDGVPEEWFSVEENKIERVELEDWFQIVR